MSFLQLTGDKVKARRSKSLDKTATWVQAQNEALTTSSDRRSNQTQTESVSRRSNQMQTEVCCQKTFIQRVNREICKQQKWILCWAETLVSLILQVQTNANIPEEVQDSWRVKTTFVCYWSCFVLVKYLLAVTIYKVIKSSMNSHVQLLGRWKNWADYSVGAVRLMAHLYCRRWTRVHGFLSYTEIGSRGLCNVNMFCIVQCSYQVWNCSPSPYPSPSPSM